MKKLCTFFFLFITVFVFAQNTFKTRLTTSGNDFVFYKTIQLNDGSFACVGYTNKNNALDYGDILVSRFDKQGVLITSKTFGTSGYDEGYSAIKTIDGGVAVIGTLNDGMGILKFNANFSLQWTKRIAFNNVGSYGTGLVQTSEGGYMATGVLYRTDNSSAGYLVKLDSVGNVLFSKKYFDFASNGIQDIAATKDGNYTLWGAAQDANESYADTTYLLKVKPDGSIIWSRYIDDSTLYSYASRVFAASDGGIVVAGSAEKVHIQQGIAKVYEQLLMAKFNAQGKMLWSKTIETSKKNQGYIMSVIEDKDGGYIFAGQLHTYKNNGNTDSTFAYAVKLSSSGALQWTKTIDAFKDDLYYSEFDDIIPTQDDGYVACGIGYYPKGTKGAIANFLYKFNANFETCDKRNVSLGTLANIGKSVAKFVPVSDVAAGAKSVSVKTTAIGTPDYLCSAAAKLQQPVNSNAIMQNKTIDKQTGSISISPNPVHQYVHVQLQSNSIGKATLQILDITGKIIISQQATITAGTNNITIPAATLSKGMYLLKVVQNDTIQAAKCIKE